MSFAIVTDEDGREVATASAEAPGTSQTAELMDADLRPGVYQISVYQKGCAGDCEFLDDEIRELCDYKFTLRADETVRLHYEFSPLGNPDCVIAELEPTGT